MKPYLQFPVTIMAGWLAAAAVAAVKVPPAGSPSVMVELARVRAVQSGDREVQAAVGYNRLHLEAVSTDEAIARVALEALAKSGDAFTLDWLQGPHRGPVATALEPVAVRTAARLRTRLEASPEVPEKTARAWMLRAAVADLTCTALEVPLKRFEHEWLKRHGANPAVRHELEALAAASQRTGHPLDPGAIRARAAAYAAQLFAGPADTVPAQP
jgi:hypothetical protein